MAAASALVAIPCCSGSQRLPSPCCSRIPFDPRLRQTIKVSSGREQTHAVLGSRFLGLLELQRTLFAQQFGEHGEQNRRLRRKVGAARAGLPVVSSIPVLGPVLNAFFNPVVLSILYAAGASRFWSGFKRTTYSDSGPTKVALTALWPGIQRNSHKEHSGLLRKGGAEISFENERGLMKEINTQDSSFYSGRKAPTSSS